MLKKSPAPFVHLIWLILLVVAPPSRAEILREAKALVQRYNDQIDRDEPSVMESRAPREFSSDGVLRLPTKPDPKRPRRYLGRSIDVRNDPVQIASMQSSWETVFYRLDSAARFAWLPTELRHGAVAPPTLQLSYVVESNFSPKTIEGLATPIVEILLVILRREKSPNAEWTLNWAFRDAPLSKIFWRHAMPTLNREHIDTRTHDFAAVLVARLPDDDLKGRTKVRLLKLETTLNGGTLFHDERPDTEDFRPVHGDVTDGHAHNEGKVVEFRRGCFSQLK